MHGNRFARGSTGFTLLEILVALVLVGLLAGALVPSMVSQVAKGEVQRVVEDLNSAGNAAKLFRIEVNRWPKQLTDLTKKPTTADQDVLGDNYPDRLLQRWDGPYLDQVQDSVITALGGKITNRTDGTFTSVSWGGSEYFTVTISGLTRPDVKRISEAVDGDTVVDNTTNPDANGRVRWDGTSGLLIYLHAPIK